MKLLKKKDIIHQINYLLNNLSIQLAKKYDNRINNELTVKQVLVLEYIKHGITSTKDLAEQLNVSTSAISQLLNKLEDKGYIERVINKNNRREIILHLAAKGNQYIGESRKLDEEIYRDVFGQLPLEDLEQLAKIFNKLNAILEEKRQ
ncbi:MarR family winged helix-turn-helix transcriptional regulator [Oceanobacillus chungangensis]|uniref:MarR family transcriptional regulator n=1 Tax=Oceanobacillus chungangensis TaxID=1229152 RepID=A0A3D8PYV7_9BACI|nr:MarR family transcriptional regulator [Oceanobacillus chungangensis]RDW20478.1 MarR family transcriptional regulator [Oceanobacillus chungangensis]